MPPLCLHLDDAAFQYVRESQASGADDDLRRTLRSNPTVRLIDASAESPDSDISALVTASSEAAFRAATSGRNVLLLNPFATEAGVRHALASTRRCVAALPHRYMPSISKMFGALQSGKLGVPGLLRMHRWHPFAGDPKTATSLMAAELDLAVLCFGAEPSEVYATLTDGAFHVHLGFSSAPAVSESNRPSAISRETSGMALLHIDAAAPDDHYYSLSVIGSSGAVHVDDHHNQQLLFTRKGRHALHSSEAHLGFAAAVQRFVEGLRLAGQGEDDVRNDWLGVELALALVERAEQSAELAEAVSNQS